ncbi:NAD(P)/FAD-dependent oxidoreductase [Hyalangium minutum]|uniref:NADH dehydrogenase n=1 Tax=Hyalangium minutum TaxID=394096 RepID=A0A085WK24_9BACT|nr:FAD-dependent oxidoreductase [Hyalangium minutum]KFE68037.1 NADH dehydrogenase [Hyalangium minutum]
MRVVILGGGYAGVVCALRLAWQARGQADITLVSASDHFVERIRLHQQAAGQSLVVRELASMLKGTGVVLKRGWVTRVDPRGEVTVEGEQVPFDRLVVALGSQVDRDRVPGVREHAWTIDAGSSAELAKQLPSIAARKGRVVVIGGGLTGIESATEMAESYPGLQVTLLSSSPLGENLSEAGRSHLNAVLRRLGISVQQGEVRRVQAGAVELSDRFVPFDACVWVGGFVVPSVVRESGLPVNTRGQVLVDPYLRALGHENVCVVGDAACVVEPLAPTGMGCKTALPMGAHVGENLARLARGLPELPFDYMDAGVCISLGRKDGLIQPMGRDGSPAHWVLKGRTAAWVKEFIVRFTVWTLLGERRRWVRTLWVKTGRTRSLEVPGRSTLAA